MTIKITKDGDCFCAYNEKNFINLQESIAGFGKTKEEALKNYTNLFNLSNKIMKKDITIDLNIINSQDSKDLAVNLLRGILEIRKDVVDEDIVETIDQLLIDNNFKIFTTNDINTKLAKSIDELGLSERSLNCFKSEGLNYISDVVRKNPSDLLKISNFGRKSLNELEEKLRKIGLNLSSNFIDV